MTIYTKLFTPSASLLFPVHIPPWTHSFSLKRVNTPISSWVKLSALPSSPIVKVVRCLATRESPNTTKNQYHNAQPYNFHMVHDNGCLTSSQ